MIAVAAEQVPRPTRAAAWKDVAGEMVVVDVQGGMVRGLNPTGGQVWSLLDGRRTAAQIANRVAELFHQPESQVLPDVLKFLTRLHELGMIEV